MVVFPAPLAPRNPVTRPAETEKLNSSTASTGPNRLVSPSTTIGFIGLFPSAVPTTIGGSKRAA